MTEPRTGSRYELLIDSAGMEDIKAAKDYYAIHPADEEESRRRG